MPLNQKSRIGIVVKSKAPLESPNDLHSLNIRRTGSNLIFYLTLSKFLRIKFPLNSLESVEYLKFVEFLSLSKRKPTTFNIDKQFLGTLLHYSKFD
jgi:hypothetical protein